MSPEAMQRMLASDYIDRRIKERMVQQYTQKGQPIVVPYGTGKVLVHPTNPFIQQYIP